jgi:hypothetical protein
MTTKALKLKTDETAMDETIPPAPTETGEFALAKGIYQMFPGSAAKVMNQYSTFGLGSADAALADADLLNDLHRDLKVGDTVCVAVFPDAMRKSAARMSARLELRVLDVKPATPEHGPSVSYKLKDREDFE